MKLNHKNTFWGSLTALILGSSCCWISSLAIWLGGATMLTATATFIGNFQIVLLIFGVVLGLVSFYLFFKKRKIRNK